MGDDSAERSDPREKDAAAGFEVHGEYRRFRQRDDIFSRSFWDDSVRSSKTEVFYATYRKPLEHFREVDGFTQNDYSLRNAAWYVTDIFAERFESDDRREGFLDEFTVLRGAAAERRFISSPDDMASEIKRVGRAFGADLVGVTAYDERWVYERKFSAKTLEDKPNPIPPGLDHVIVIATSMDYDLIRTVPSALSGAATGLGYSRDTIALLSLGQYIRNLGFRAVESLNDTALAVPFAIQAGLGEYGRHGLLITEEFGPRVRLGKIFTDLPLAHDRPRSFGVKEFCDICRRCTDACPPKAIPGGAPSKDTYNRSNLLGVTKWSVDAEKCFGFWVNQNSDCSICIRVCPYNKDFSQWWHRLGRRLAATPLRRLLLWLDAALGYGARRTARWWWRKR
jgi:epoxyqueuosine reductase